MNPEQFKKIRKKLGLTQQDLSVVLCLSAKKAVGNIETGFRRPSKLSAVLMSYLGELSNRKANELIANIKKHSLRLEREEYGRNNE